MPMITRCGPYRRFLRRISDQQSRVPTIILHFDPLSRDLRVWLWPVDADNTRINPTDISDHRLTHHFKVPCCLCASDNIGMGYTECAIYIPRTGKYGGEYVAGCAKGRCGYLLALERMYTRRGLLLSRYPIRTVNEAVPEPIYYEPEDAVEAQAPSSPSASSAPSYQGLMASIPVLSPPPRARPETAFDRLMRLDSPINPGLSENEFRRMFAKCRCGKVMTRRVFEGHICAVAAAAVHRRPAVIIDLTGDLPEQITVASNGSATHLGFIDLTIDSDDE